MLVAWIMPMGVYQSKRIVRWYTYCMSDPPMNILQSFCIRLNDIQNTIVDMASYFWTNRNMLKSLGTCIYVS